MFPSSARCAQLRRKAESRFYCIELFATTEYRGIAQLVEQRSPKPRVQSSSLCAPAKHKRNIRRMFLLCFVDERDTRTLIKYSPQADISVAARLRNPKSLPKLCVRREFPSLCAPAKTNRHPRMPVCFNRDTGYEGLSKI